MKKAMLRKLALAVLTVMILSMACAIGEGLNLNGGYYVWDQDPVAQAPTTSKAYSYLLGMTCTIRVGSGNMRADASMFSAKVGIVLSGERYMILGVKQDYRGDLWYLINNEGVYGFVSSGIARV